MATPRIPNNPVTSKILLGAVRNVIATGTALCNIPSGDPTGVAQIQVRSRYAVAKGAFPAVNLTTGVQKFARTSSHMYAGMVVVNVGYYNRWLENDQQTMDQIIQDMEDDLERIRANLESNETLAMGAVEYAVSIPGFSVTADKGEQDLTFPSTPMLYRTLMATINILEYLALPND